MSSFVDQRTQEIFQNASIDALNTPPASEANKSLKATLAVLNSPPTDAQLLHSLDVLEENGFGDVGALENPLAIGVSERVIAGLYARAMKALLEQGLELDKEARFWSEVERSGYNSSYYLLQTLPSRLVRLTGTFIDSLRHRHIPITWSTFQAENIRRLFPSTNRPSELLVAAFPHLGIHGRLFPSSPFLLTRDECRHKRKQLERLRDDRALRVGLLAAASHELEHTLSATNHSTSQLEKHLLLLQLALGTDGQMASFDYTLLQQIEKNKERHEREVNSLRRPSRLVRIWPRLLLLPPACYLIFRYIYQPRDSIRQHLKEAAETIRVFWQSWVIQPIQGIIATVRTGGDEGIRVISKDALRADMASLERMAVDLGKEKLGYTKAQIESLHEQIRVGDLTPVLQVYENDIKTPIRSAVAGTLVRSLLIQVQKVKVDVDFALSGIDKLLRSQELTFGFVGLAPALLIVYSTFDWLRSTWRGGSGKGRLGGQTQRQRIWSCMRRIDKLLIVPPKMGQDSAAYSSLLSSYIALTREDSHAANVDVTLLFDSTSRAERRDESTGRIGAINDPSIYRTNRAREDEELALSPLTNGLLLLSSTQLRAFAETHLRRSSFRDEFLEDVRDLEDGTLSVKSKRLVLTRMYRSWGRLLGWDNCGEL
ncbi:related to NCA2-control of mitochondrial synthesis of Atp6p and Atp8p [Serendipita indica DSM 11827]|uniref:Related to NCA2-control of mitochondrial synthesis of Atp6p and Atp8p n=1 Tax=Serendipita indica (strain DSM 11827) TaxID=1109443 RepID=G4T8M1_SERID|nr:related to NCA2-control of mitochondrial synthesis of Atp6p and Atp8p [Serendipita indica DSM 11827]